MCGRGRFALQASDVVAAAGLHSAPGSSASSSSAAGGGAGGKESYDEPQGDASSGQDATDDMAPVDESRLQQELDGLRRENFGPAMVAMILVRDAKTGKRELRKAQWGLISKNPGKAITAGDFFQKFNAREDNLEYAHRPRLARQHCVVFFNGFYEWKNNKDPLSKKVTKQPYYIYPKEQAVLRLAGLYETCVDPGSGEELTTFTIITVNAAKSFEWLHHRMPAVLPNDTAVNEWLGATEWNPKTHAILRPDETSLQWHPVTPSMGKTSYQDSDCTKAIKLEKKTPSVLSMWSKQEKSGSSKPNTTPLSPTPLKSMPKGTPEKVAKPEPEVVSLLSDSPELIKVSSPHLKRKLPAGKYHEFSSPLAKVSKKEDIKVMKLKQSSAKKPAKPTLATSPAAKGQRTLGAFFAKKD